MLFSYSQLLNKATREMDLQGEPQFDTGEMVGYMNEAVDNAETAIHTCSHEDNYFLIDGMITLISGQRDYAFPVDIYGNKLRKVFYNNGAAAKYEIMKVRDLRRTQYFQAGDPYEFLVINKQLEVGGNVVRLFPTPVENGAVVPIFYIRNCRILTTSLTDVNNLCEVPDIAINFVNQHLRWSIAKKVWRGRPELIAAEKAERDTQYDLMTATMKEMIPDENNLMQMDTTAYQDQSPDGFYTMR